LLFFFFFFLHLIGKSFAFGWLKGEILFFLISKTIKENWKSPFLLFLGREEIWKAPVVQGASTLDISFASAKCSLHPLFLQETLAAL